MSYNTFHESLAIPRVTSESTNSELDELWTDILGKHWRFVESDENLEKIERRKEFEGDFYILLFYPHSEQKKPSIEWMSHKDKLNCNTYIVISPFLYFIILPRRQNNQIHC